jgi:hypothetical protein
MRPISQILYSLIYILLTSRAYLLEEKSERRVCFFFSLVVLILFRKFYTSSRCLNLMKKENILCSEFQSLVITSKDETGGACGTNGGEEECI